MVINPDVDSAIALMFEHGYVLGIHEMMYSKQYTLLDSFDEDDALYSRSAVLMNSLCHITPDGEGGFILSLGAFPFGEDYPVNIFHGLEENISNCASSCLDEWQDRNVEDPLYYENFTCFSWDQVAQAVQIGERTEIEPILNTFIAVFSHYSSTFLEYSDEVLISNFDGDDLTDESLEAAFMTFVKFIQDKIMPKLSQSPYHLNNVLQLP